MSQQNAKTPKSQTIIALEQAAACLRKFALHHYIFFDAGFSWLDGIDHDHYETQILDTLDNSELKASMKQAYSDIRKKLGKDNTWKLIPSEEFHSGYVKYHVTRRMVDDFDSIVTVFAQRQEDSPIVLTKFHSLDLVAKHWFPKSDDVSFWIAEGVLPVTYMRSNTLIRITPYSKVAFIGLPVSIGFVRGVKEWIAIAHEVGHYVYWNGRLKNSSTGSTDFIPQIINQLIMNERFAPYIDDWAEEIFADIYACIVAGPVAAYHMQDRLGRFSRTEMLEDDGTYPLPILRPQIYYRALMELGFNESTIEKIKDEWKDTLKAARLSSQRFDNKGRSLMDIERELVRFVNAVITSIPNVKTLVSQWNSADLQTNPHDRKELFNIYEGEIREIISSLGPTPGEDTDTPWWQPAFEFVNNFLRLWRPYVSVPSAFEGIFEGTADYDPDASSCDPTWIEWVATLVDTVDVEGDNCGGVDEISYYICKEKPIPIATWLKVLQANGWTTEGPHGYEP